MTSKDQDDAWRAIVENYGERSTLDEEPVAAASAPEPEPGVFVAPEETLDVEPDLSGLPGESAEERYVPPTLPPIPRPAPLRQAAWAGVIGAPVVVVLMALFSLYAPALVRVFLVVAFVGGFLYLVATMDREPREPWDNGAQV